MGNQNVRAEWAVGDPDDCASDDDVREINGPTFMTTTDRDFGRSVLIRDVWVGPWRGATPEEIASGVSTTTFPDDDAPICTDPVCECATRCLVVGDRIGPAR